MTSFLSDPLTGKEFKEKYPGKKFIVVSSCFSTCLDAKLYYGGKACECKEGLNVWHESEATQGVDLRIDYMYGLLCHNGYDHLVEPEHQKIVWEAEVPDDAAVQIVNSFWYNCMVNKLILTNPTRIIEYHQKSLYRHIYPENISEEYNDVFWQRGDDGKEISRRVADFTKIPDEFITPDLYVFAVTHGYLDEKKIPVEAMTEDLLYRIETRYAGTIMNVAPEELKSDRLCDAALGGSLAMIRDFPEKYRTPDNYAKCILENRFNLDRIPDEIMTRKFYDRVKFLIKSCRLGIKHGVRLSDKTIRFIMEDIDNEVAKPEDYSKRVREQLPLPQPEAAKAR